MQTSLSGRSMTSASDRQTEFQREVAGRFGLVPNFFSSAPDAPEIIERLWDFAKAAYLDNPIPSLFKERLFVYLSRFCEVRYCIVRHCAFLVGRGHSSGDPSVAVQSVEQAIRLLKTPPPWDARPTSDRGRAGSTSHNQGMASAGDGGRGLAYRCRHPCCSWSRDAQSAPGALCVRPWAAIASSTCWACSPSSALLTTGRCSTPSCRSRKMCASF